MGEKWESGGLVPHFFSRVLAPLPLPRLRLWQVSVLVVFGQKAKMPRMGEKVYGNACLAAINGLK